MPVYQQVRKTLESYQRWQTRFCVSEPHDPAVVGCNNAVCCTHRSTVDLLTYTRGHTIFQCKKTMRCCRST